MITWLASYPKSGNTWVRMFLAAVTNGGRASINEMGALSYDDLTAYLWQVVSPKPVADLTVQDAAALRGAALCHLVTSRRGSTMVKTHSAFGAHERFPMIPPSLTERAVYVVRDPRDVAVSWAHHTERSIDDAIRWMGDPAWCFAKAPGLYNVVGSWQSHAMSWARGSSEYFPVHVMRYEDMHADPHHEFARLIDFLGWPTDADTICTAVENTSFDALRAQERTEGFREGSETGAAFFRRGQPGAWRDELSEDQVARIESTCAEAMREFGYDGETRATDQVHGEDSRGDLRAAR